MIIDLINEKFVLNQIKQNSLNIGALCMELQQPEGVHVPAVAELVAHHAQNHECV